MIGLMVRFDRTLRRVYVGGKRLHHGALGCLLIVVGTVLAAHDKRDVRLWFRLSTD